jgi:hypothetical protein
MAVSSDATGQIFGKENGTQSEKMVGVTGLSPFQYAGDSFYPRAFGKAVLRTTDLEHSDGADVGIVSSDDPTLKHNPTYKGRSVLFSFAFEGINDNTGSATRAQVLQRVLAWLDDQATARVGSATYRAGKSVALKATLKAGSGITAVQYTWEIGSTILKSTDKSTKHRFPHAGTYRMRVQIMDSLGHTAVSPWANVKVR